MDIDRDRASALGVICPGSKSAVRPFGTQQISHDLPPTNQYQVIMELEPKFQVIRRPCFALYVASSNIAGNLVPLSAAAHRRGPLARYPPPRCSPLVAKRSLSRMGTIR